MVIHLILKTKSIRNKTLCILLLVLICFALTSCGKSKAAKEVDALIDGLGEITVNSLDAITTVENALSALEKEDYDQVEKKDQLVKAREQYNAALVNEQIEQIGEVSELSQNSIQKARSAFENLSDSEKQNVTKIGLLIDAEKSLEVLHAQKVDDIINEISPVSTLTINSEKKVVEARDAYDCLSENEKKLVKGLSLLESAEEKIIMLHAERVDGYINAIGQVTAQSSAAISNARNEYQKLSDEEKSLVKNLAILEEAEESFTKIQAEEVIALINDLAKITIDDEYLIEKAENAYESLPSKAKALVTNSVKIEDAKTRYKELQEKAYKGALSRINIIKDDIRSISFYEPKRMPKYTNSRCNVLPYIGLHTNMPSSNWLIIRYNYSRSDWVFFKKVTIAVDDDRYYKSFNYFSITHDVGGGRVGEVIDEEATNKDLEMLRAIVKSKKTIVRFEGDEHYHDYTMTSEDKAAIKDVLTVYDYLNR